MSRKINLDVPTKYFLLYMYPFSSGVTDRNTGMLVFDV